MRHWLVNGLLGVWLAATGVSIFGYHAWPDGFGYLSLSLFFVALLTRDFWRRRHPDRFANPS